MLSPRRFIAWFPVLVATIGLACASPFAFGQDSDPSAATPPLRVGYGVPPAPVLRPVEEMKTIRLVPGYRLELVAADPLIQDPIAITFDPDGRLWVCEMRGFMPDIEGTDENAPVGVISVLDDTDGDGVMDKSTVFLDSLILPRGLCWTLDGMLVCENGTIWLCADTDGDDRCDKKQVVCKYNRGNLEHSLNGLMPALDNRIYNAKEGLRLQRVDGKWVADRCAARGQWGLTQDNHGRLIYNVNASLIRGDLVPCYSTIAQTSNPYVDVPLYDDQEVFPIRPTPGVNRGYIPGFLRPDGTILEANSNCGPVVYRGDNLPEELVGDVFIPEPAGNLIRRQVLYTDNGRQRSRNAYDRNEFLASTDERFRPVNMFNAPDGTLYIVDMYRGIIQHGAFITPYLREQILARQLDQGIHYGRIYRVVHESTLDREPVAMTQLGSAELVNYLSHSNGWHRDIAQQLIVQRGDGTVVPDLEEMAATSKNPLGRLHAVWTLAGLEQPDPELLYELLSDPDVHVRASAITLYQRYLAVESMADLVLQDIASCGGDEDQLVRLQVVQAIALVDSPDADPTLAKILKSISTDQKQLDAVLSGFADRETEFLTIRLRQNGWKHREPWRERVLGMAAEIMWRQRNPMEVLRFCHLLDSIPEEDAWQTIALLEGVKETVTRRRRRRFAPFPQSTPSDQTGQSTSQGPASPLDRGNAAARPQRSGSAVGRMRAAKMRLDTPPAGLDRLRKSDDPRLAAAADAFADKLIWPGKDGEPLPSRPQLTVGQQRLYDLGRSEYRSVCAGCHHESGYGLAAKGPALLGSPWLENPQRLIRIVLHGIQGPLEVNGELYNAENRLSMPGMHATFDDEKVAGILTYIRRDFFADASPVEPETVAAIRRIGDRAEPWTQLELIEAVP